MAYDHHYYLLQIGKFNQRPIGCPSLSAGYGDFENLINVTDGWTPVPKKGNWDIKWLGVNDKNPEKSKSPWPWAMSPAIDDCPPNDYAPKGKKISDIVDELASDNELFAEKFLEGWQQMTSKGYSDGDLRDGPENGWFGHYSLKNWVSSGYYPMENLPEDMTTFEDWITNFAPLKFTNPRVCIHPSNVILGIFLDIFMISLRLTHGFVAIMDIWKPLVESGFPNILKQLKGIGTNITVKVNKLPEIHRKEEMWIVDLIWNLPLMKALKEMTLLMSIVQLKISN